jgi:hypothetical protein
MAQPTALPPCALAGCRTVQVFSSARDGRSFTAYYCPLCDAVTALCGPRDEPVTSPPLVWERREDELVLREVDRDAWEAVPESQRLSWEKCIHSTVATFLRSRTREWIHCPTDAEDARACYQEAGPGTVRWRLARCGTCGTRVLEAFTPEYGWERLMSVLPNADGSFRVLREYPASLARPEARELLARASQGAT